MFLIGFMPLLATVYARGDAQSYRWRGEGRTVLAGHGEYALRLALVDSVQQLSAHWPATLL